MPINSVGDAAQTLQKFDAKSWSKSANINSKNELSIKEPAKLTPASVNESEVSSKVAETFGELLANSINHVNKLQEDANVAIKRLSTGQSNNLHETLLKVEQADIAFRTMNQVRLKVIDAYKEIMKMQV